MAINKKQADQILISKMLDKLAEEYPRGVDLVHIDYRDRIEDEKILEELAQTGYSDKLDDNLMEWLADSQYESINYLLNELDEADIAAIEAADDPEAVRDAMCQWLLDHDTSDPEKDIIKNTPMQYYYYDLNHEVIGVDYGGNLSTEVSRIMHRLKLNKLPEYKHAEVRYKLRELVNNSYYGGDLVILFSADPLDFYGDITDKYITFSGDYSLCIMDRGNGSGHNVNIPGDPALSFRFRRANLHHDEGAAGYSYSGDVCGLIGGQYQAVIKWTDEKPADAVNITESEKQKAFAARQARYIATYAAGQCSAGDMDIARHRDVYYRNEYPAGNKCPHCGMFWID